MDDTEKVSNVPIIEKLHCTRCLGSWYPRTPNKPAVCPKCKNRYWDKPRRVKKNSQDEGKLIFPDHPCYKADQKGNYSAWVKQSHSTSLSRFNGQIR